MIRSSGEHSERIDRSTRSATANELALVTGPQNILRHWRIATDLSKEKGGTNVIWGGNERFKYDTLLCDPHALFSEARWLSDHLRHQFVDYFEPYDIRSFVFLCQNDLHRYRIINDIE